MRVVSEGFYARVAVVARLVPKGRLTTYGDVAAALGSPSVARHVGWALAGLRERGGVPWQRVINAQGRVSARGEFYRAEAQYARLAAEGVLPNAAGRFDLQALRYTFDPTEVAEALALVQPASD